MESIIFYSGVYNRAIRGLSFLSFALVDVKDRKSYPLFTRQMEKAKKEVQKKKNQKQKRRRQTPNSFLALMENKNKEDERESTAIVSIMTSWTKSISKRPKRRKTKPSQSIKWKLSMLSLS